MAAALGFSAVTFGYRKGAAVLHALDLEIDAGEMAAVIGPNGTGKTTLVRLASGHLRPQAGRILLAGDDLSSLTARERARRVAVVPQETHLAFDYSVAEVVSMGRAPHQGLLGLQRPADREQLRLAMERTDVLELAARSFLALSGGERQRTIIARALVQEPRILLLDEPTAFLDLRHRLVVYELLTRLNRDSGLTVVVVSHDVDLVARYCDRLILLHEGRAVADGKPLEVLEPELLLRVYGVEAEVRVDPATGRPHVSALRAGDGGVRR